MISKQMITLVLSSALIQQTAGITRICFYCQAEVEGPKECPEGWEFVGGISPRKVPAYLLWSYSGTSDWGTLGRHIGVATTTYKNGVGLITGLTVDVVPNAYVAGKFCVSVNNPGSIRSRRPILYCR